MEMMLSGEYIVPHINGWVYYNKPPLFNWMMIGCFKIFGSFEEWVVRMPSILSFLLIGLVNFFFVRKYINKEVAFLSSLFFITSADIFFYGTINAGEIDLFFSLLVFLQIISIFHFHQQKNYLLLFLASYFFAALGTLTKGPPSIAFQGITLLALFIQQKEFKSLLHWKHFAGLGFFLLICGGYFYAYSFQEDPVPFITQLFKEASQRTGVESKITNTLLKSVSFPLLLMQLLLPWSIFILYLFRNKIKRDLKSNALVNFSVLFILSNILLYWFTAELRNRYIYMFFPFCMIILAYFYDKYREEKVAITKWIEHLFFFGIIMFTTVFTLSPFIEITKELPYIKPLAVVFTLLGIAALYLFRKYKAQRILIFIVVIALTKVGTNFTYLPLLKEKSDRMLYVENIDKILSITKNAPIHWTSFPYSFESDASIGPLQFTKLKLTTAPLLAYQVPYYITKGNGHIMQYDPEMEKGVYYLAPDTYLADKNVEEFYRFRETWTKQVLVLCKRSE